MDKSNRWRSIVLSGFIALVGSVFAGQRDSAKSDIEILIQKEAIRYLTEIQKVCSNKAFEEGLELLKKGTYSLRHHTRPDGQEAGDSLWGGNCIFSTEPKKNRICSINANDDNPWNWPADSVISLEESNETALQYAKIFAPHYKNPEYYTELPYQDPKQRIAVYWIYDRIGKLKTTDHVEIAFSRTDKSFLWADFSCWDNNKHSKAPIKSEKECYHAAIDAYRRYAPYKSSILTKSELCIGPIRLWMAIPNEMTTEHLNALQNEIGYPHYVFTFSDADSKASRDLGGPKPLEEYRKYTEVYVDAISGKGTAIGAINLDDGFSGPAKRIDAKAALNCAKKVGIAGDASLGKLAVMKDVRDEKPEGQPVVLIQGKNLYRAYFDKNSETVWIAEGTEWRKYRPDSKLLTRIRKAAAEPVKPYGKKVEVSST